MTEEKPHGRGSALPCYLSAAIWKTIKPQLSGRFLITLNAVATDARWWFGCLFIVLLGLIFSQNFERWLLPSAFRPQASSSATTPPLSAPAAREIPAVVTEKSPLLGLDDAARWQMTTKFYDILNANGEVKCLSRIQIDNESKTALELWKELQPILHYA